MIVSCPDHSTTTITHAQVEEVVRDFIEWWNGYGSEYEGIIPKLDVQLYLAHRAEKERLASVAPKEEP